MPETLFEEMKRYVRFDAEDENALRALAPHASPHFRTIAEEFYARLEEHAEARAVFSGPAQVERLKGTLCEWMHLLLHGPWDENYYAKRARIGRVHVRIQLPQRYMFGAMNLIRVSLQRIARAATPDDAARSVVAIAKILDIELAIMLETYREAFVDKVQELERLEKDVLASRLAIVEARYQEIVETAWSLISTFDASGTILLFNKRCEEISGLDRAEAIGRDWYELFVAPAERERVRALAATVLEQQRVSGFESRFEHCGGEARRVRWHLTTLPSGRGPVLCALGSDVTEEHALGTRTRLAERLAALGTMAAGLAHEIRNPLNAAHLQLTLLRRKLARADGSGADVPGAQTAAELAGSEITRLGKLVEEFLQFARPQPLLRRRADLRATAEEVVALLGPEASQAGVALTLDAERPCTIEYDEERLKQVLLNLVRNALEATGKNGHVVVRLSNGADGPRLAVEDDGPGLSAADAPIFEPFYTTKEAGTGLGLAIVHRIVADHGGQVTVDSRAGRTVFAISLPPGAS